MMPLEYLPLAAATINFAVTLYVLTRSLRAKLSWVYLLWGTSVTGWSLGTFALFRAADPEAALWWARFQVLGLVFVPVSLLHLGFLIAQKPVSRLTYVLYAAHTLFGMAALTPWLVAEARMSNQGFRPVAGSLGWLFLATYLYTCTRGVWLLTLDIRQQPLRHRRRLSVLLVAFAILIPLGINDLLVAAGLDYYPLSRVPLRLWGGSGVLVCTLLVGYGTLQHELLDVRITLAQLAAQGVRIGVVALVGTVLLALAMMRLPDELTLVGAGVALAVLVLSTILAVCYFPKMFGRSDMIVDRWILGERLRHWERVEAFVKSIPLYTDIQLLMKDLHQELVETVGVSRYQVYLWERKTEAASLLRFHPAEAESTLTLDRNSPVMEYFRQTRAESLGMNLAYQAPVETVVERAAREQMRPLRGEFCFPFWSGEELFGLLVVGERLGYSFYSQPEQQLLASLSRNLALVINQIRLQNEILAAEELELLGRMSRGMAHDLNNLITPVWTYLQLACAGEAAASGEQELLPVARRNLETIREYVQQALMVSEHKEPAFRPTELDRLVRDTIALHEAAAKRHEVDLRVSSPGACVAEVDGLLFQRLLSNLILNAIDASSGQQTVEVTLGRQPAERPHRDWVRVAVIDHGAGMSQEVLAQAARPYFTTKAGDGEHRGFGLGLAICRKIALLHGGQLTIASQEGQGTTVQVDLPARQESAAEPVHAETA